MNNQSVGKAASQIEARSLSNEISDKAQVIAKLTAQAYVLASHNKELEKEVKSLKAKLKPKTKGKSSK